MTHHDESETVTLGQEAQAVLIPINASICVFIEAELNDIGNDVLVGNFDELLLTGGLSVLSRFDHNS